MLLVIAFGHLIFYCWGTDKQKGPEHIHYYVGF